MLKWQCQTAHAVCLQNQNMAPTPITAQARAEALRGSRDAFYSTGQSVTLRFHDDSLNLASLKQDHPANIFLASIKLPFNCLRRPLKYWFKFWSLHAISAAKILDSGSSATVLAMIIIITMDTSGACRGSCKWWFMDWDVLLIGGVVGIIFSVVWLSELCTRITYWKQRTKLDIPWLSIKRIEHIIGAVSLSRVSS